MKFLYSLIAVALLVSCSNKKGGDKKDPLDPNNFDHEKTDKTDEQTDDSGWSSKDKKQAISDCVDYVTHRSDMTTSEAKDGCSCTIDKIQSDMSFDDFEAVYKEEERPADKKMQKAYDKLDEAANGCLKKNTKKDNDDDEIKPKKHKDDDE